MKKYSKHLKILILLLLAPLAISQINSTNEHLLKNAHQLSETMSRKEPEENAIEKIKVDCALSVGGWCICAEHLRENGLRKISSPLDWMRKYSLDTVARMFETKFKDFFKNVSVVDRPSGTRCRVVVETKNNIESIHFMPRSAPFDEEYKKFSEMMKKRAKKLNQMLLSSKSILLVNCRYNPETNEKNSTDRELKIFAKRFAKAYPNLKKIYLMDIHNDENTNIRKRTVYEDNKIKIIQYKFKNVDSKNYSWIGNTETWNKILKGVSLTKNEKDVT